MAKKPKVIIIVGPTSSGKTALSLTLAKKFNGEVVSADSRQVYQGFKLLSGAIRKKEQAGIKHHLLHIISPKKVFTVADYQPLAHKAINQILAKNKVPIIVGGTGLYIDSILYKTDLPAVAPNPKLRAELAKKSASELATQLEKLDPIRYQNIDQHNKVRLIRAIEIATTLGYVPERQVTLNPDYDFLLIYLKPEPAVLTKKILARLKERIQKGLIREAVQLIKTKKVTKKRLRELGLEFKWSADYLDKKITKEQFLIGLLNDHLKYVKRQHTWFKRYPKAFTPKNTTEAVVKVKKWLGL